MLSRRNFAAITAMMLVVCFLFLLPQQMKEGNNPYYVNAYAKETVQHTQADRWRQPDIRTAADLDSVDCYCMLVGSEDTAVGRAVAYWAELSKTPLVCLDSVGEAVSFGGKTPWMVFLDPDSCQFRVDTRELMELNRRGVTLVFCSLPDTSDVSGIYRLRKLLGIRRVEQEQVALESVHLFSGFLLGGERIYESEGERMDLSSSAPWVMLSSGTEVYMVGELSLETLPEQDYRHQLVPPLVWRSSVNGANVFVVNGDYIRDNMGVGFLSAIAAEDRSWYLYPVVNSQVLTVANFPSMADENQAEIQSRYGRSQLAVVRDLLWPSLESMSEVTGFPMSCFITPQWDYLDEAEPDSGLIAYYLKLIKERGAEAGVSVAHNGDISMAEKREWDAAFLLGDEQPYRYCSAFVPGKEVQDFLALGAGELVSVSLDSRERFFDYLGEDVLCQYVTQDALAFTYRSDLELLSQQTALCYSNVMLDMLRTTWPEENEPGWEVYYERAVSTLQTYWRSFRKFDRLSISQSDTRIRNFLNMDCRQQRRGDTVVLEIDGFDEEADVILRTHMEDVTGVAGGSFVKLEKDAWLIKAEKPEVEITLAVSTLFDSGL